MMHQYVVDPRYPILHVDLRLSREIAGAKETTLRRLKLEHVVVVGEGHLNTVDEVFEVNQPTSWVSGLASFCLIVIQPVLQQRWSVKKEKCCCNQQFRQDQNIAVAL